MLITHEKPDIVGYLEEHEGLDFTYFPSSSRPYFTARCPFHDDKNPSFWVYPDMQKWTCPVCYPGYHDIIDFYQYKNDWDFLTARDYCCTPLSEEEVVAKSIAAKELEKGRIDPVRMAIRLSGLIDRLGVRHAQMVFGAVDELVLNGDYAEVDRVLRWYGV